MNAPGPFLPSAGAPAPGWYRAPDGRPASRWWDGERWTGWLTDGYRSWTDGPVRRALTRDDLPALRFVEEVFLPDAEARGALGPQQRAGLAGLVQQLAVEAASASVPGDVRADAAAPVPPEPRDTIPPPERALFASPAAGAPSAPAAPASGAPSAEPAYSAGPPASAYPPVPASGYSVPPAAPVPRTALPAPARAPVRLPAPPAPPREPSRVARWWATTWERIGSDVAVHGLAYLGVLLLFVGVFGLVAFAFGSVTPAMRPVAELASAAVTFGAARLLLRHGAIVVARAMEAVGGLILPLMLIASTVDGFGFPPELRGTAVPIVLAAVCVAVAGGYAAWTVRHPDSGLRYVVGPTLWLGVAMGAIGLGRPIPSGQDIAVPGSGQVAAIAVAVALTALAVRLADGARGGLAEVLVPATRRAVLVGSVVVAVLGAVTWLAEGWPTAAVIVTAVAIAATWQLLPRVPAGVADVGTVLWWVLVAVRLLVLATEGGASRGLAGTVSALGFAALLEVLGRRARSAVALGVAAGGLALTVLAITASMPWIAGLTAVLTAWAATRRRRPFAVPGAAGVLDGLTAGLPVVGLLAVAASEGPEVGLLSAAGVVLLATVLAGTGRRVGPGRFGRGEADAFWPRWWWSVGGATVAATVFAGLILLVESVLGTSGVLVADGGVRSWAVPIAALALAVSAAFGPLPAAGRVWAVVGLGWWAWLTWAVLAAVGPMLAMAVPAVAGLTLVLAAHLVRGGERSPAVLAALGFSGHALGLVTLVLTDGGWPAELALVAAVLGWAVTALAAERDRSAVADRLDRLGALGRWAPWSLTLVGIPLLALGALHLASVVDLGDPWGSMPLLVTGLLYAGLVRAVPAVRGSLALGPLTWLAFLAPVVGALIAGGELPFVVAGAGLVVAVALLPTRVPANRPVDPSGVHPRTPPTPRRHPVMTWTAWAVVVPVLVVLVRWLTPSVDLDRSDLFTLGAAVGASGLLIIGALLADGARFTDPRALPRRRVLLPPAVLGAVQLLGWLLIAVVAPTPGRADVVLIAAGLLLAIALLSGVGSTAGLALVTAWLGWHLASDPGGPWAEVATAGGLVAAGVAVSVLPGRRRGWSRWDVPIALAGVPAAVLALGRAEGDQVAPVFTVIGLLVVGAAVRLGRHHSRLVLSEVLGTLGTGLILLGSWSASPGWFALALLALAAAHTALAVVREVGVARLARQVVGALAALAAWGAMADWLGWTPQQSSDVTALVGAAVTVLLVSATAQDLLGRSWAAVWGSAGTLMSAVAVLAVALAWSGEPAWSWWHVLALLLLAFAAGLLVSTWGWASGRWAVIALGLVALLAALDVLGWSPGARSAVLVGASAAFASGMVLLRGPTGRDWLGPVTAGGSALLVLALVADPGGFAAVLAGATVQLAAAGYAWRQIGLRLAAPVLAWATWAALVPEIVAGATASWYTLPVGLALLAVVGLWRAERRGRGLAPADQPGIVLELTGIGFLVVTSWVQAFTVSVLHALIAAGIGALVLVWGLTTRVRRRVAAAAVVVLVSLVLAVAVPLVSLLPAWGGAAVWIAVAVVGLIAVLAATLLEKGRAALRSASDRAGTQGWE